MKPLHLGILAVIIIAVGILLFLKSNAPVPTGNQSSSSSNSSSSSYSSMHSDIFVTRPTPNGIVTSPLTVLGEARGTWYFEASFPVKLLDSNGNQLAIAPTQAQGEWMTTNFVPYLVTLTFTPTTATGTLVLEKDNPSGLPEYADSISIPVQF